MRLAHHGSDRSSRVRDRFRIRNLVFEREREDAVPLGAEALHDFRSHHPILSRTITQTSTALMRKPITFRPPTNQRQGGLMRRSDRKRIAITRQSPAANSFTNNGGTCITRSFPAAAASSPPILWPSA